MYDYAKLFARFENEQAVNIPTTNPAITIVLHWQRCYQSAQSYDKSPSYIGWFSYQNTQLRSFASSNHVTIANARDTVSTSLAKEEKQFYLLPLFRDLGTVEGNELEKLSLLCFGRVEKNYEWWIWKDYFPQMVFEQAEKDRNCWILKRRFPNSSNDLLHDVAPYNAHTIMADLDQMLVLYHRPTGDTSLWI